MISAPRIDSRTATEIENQLRGLLKVYAPKWKGEPGDFGNALVRIFARYAEIVIERLNRTPEKNLLAYLDMLGASLLPPQPARVPLTFSLAAGSAADGVVPAATQVAAPPPEGGTEPLIFETERELTVIAAALDKVIAREPSADTVTDLSPSAPLSGDRRAFRGTTPLDHSLYIGLDDLLGRNALRQLRLDFVIDPGRSAPDPRTVFWSIVGATGGTTRDSTAGLTKTEQVTFSGLPVVPRQSVNGLQSRWLRGRLATPIAQRDAAATDRVSGLTVSADLGATGLPVDRAFANAAPLDTTKDFLPFGERPRLGDALYLSAGDAFAAAGAQVTLKVAASAQPPTPAQPSATAAQLPGPTLSWEYWDGGRWVALGTSRPTSPASAAGGDFSDGTAALTKDGDVKFRLGPNPAMLAVNGADGHWLRVRIAGGNYGEDAKYVPEGTSYKYIRPTLAPPSIAAITVDYTLTLPGQRADRILTYNDVGFAEKTGSASFQPFRPTADSNPTLYLGFALPATRSAFPNRPVGLYFDIAEPASDTRPDNPAAATPPRLVWECWGGAGGWRQPGLRDNTRNLTRPGVLEFLAPATFAPRREFGLERYWLRCRWEAGDFAFEPRLRRVLLNTVMAAHATTILDETLGSSDGAQGQRFVTTRRPVLHGQEELRVREPDLPSADEREAAGGDDAITVTRDAGGRPIEIWVRWREVPDFYGSGPRHRHYVLDHVTGTVSFGDGVNGLVPPPGPGNLRLTRYRTGGGSAGNCAAGTIVQLKTTIPYVDRVTNPEPARGGADAETIDSLRERAPRTIRHRERAVTIEDYEDLAMLASPEVARAKCVPLHDLSVDPEAKGNPLPGKVSVIIVPRSTEAQPLPSRVLLERVAGYLDARRLPVVDLKIVAPDYVRVDIEAKVALTAINRAAEVHSRIVAALQRFLHPLTGGLDGSGWDFGRRPQESDLLRCIGEIPGVDHIRSLTVTETPATTLALIYAGSLDIAVAAGNA